MNFWTQLYTTILTTSVLTGGAFFLLKKWAEHRIAESIKHGYDKKLEEFKFEMRKREQAALIADLFSKWIIIKKDESNAREMNRLSFEMSLWLPDEVAIEINKRLKNLINARPAEDLLVECRKIIQGTDTKLRPEDITFFGI